MVRGDIITINMFKYKYKNHGKNHYNLVLPPTIIIRLNYELEYIGCTIKFLTEKDTHDKNIFKSKV